VAGCHCEELSPRPRTWHFRDNRIYRWQQTRGWVVGFEWTEGVNSQGGTWSMRNY
jgi:hypothetical protein